MAVASTSRGDCAPSLLKVAGIVPYSSNWKALRKVRLMQPKLGYSNMCLCQTMPVSIAAQEMNNITKKRKREPSKDLLNAADFVRGSAPTSTSAVLTKHTDGKNSKGKAREVMLGEGSVSGHKAECVRICLII